MAMCPASVTFVRSRPRPRRAWAPVPDGGCLTSSGWTGKLARATAGPPQRLLCLAGSGPRRGLERGLERGGAGVSVTRPGPSRGR